MTVPLMAVFRGQLGRMEGGWRNDTNRGGVSCCVWRGAALGSARCRTRWLSPPQPYHPVFSYSVLGGRVRRVASIAAGPIERRLREVFASVVTIWEEQGQRDQCRTKAFRAGRSDIDGAGHVTILCSVHLGRVSSLISGTSLTQAGRPTRIRAVIALSDPPEASLVSYSSGRDLRRARLRLTPWRAN